MTNPETTDLRQLKAKIKSRGHWSVIVRPTQYVEERIAGLQSLLPLLQQLAVRRTGMWGFPHLVDHRRPTRGLHWIEDHGDYGPYIYLWRFTQSGQFFHLSGMISDWLSESIWPAHPDWKPMTTCGIGESLWRFTDIFEFASRLATDEVGTDGIGIYVNVAKLRDRRLWVDDARRAPVTGHYVAHVNEFSYERVFDRTELIADARKLALAHVCRKVGFLAPEGEGAPRAKP
jgi:hypothetical protein